MNSKFNRTTLETLPREMMYLIYTKLVNKVECNDRNTCNRLTLNWNSDLTEEEMKCVLAIYHPKDLVNVFAGALYMRKKHVRTIMKKVEESSDFNFPSVWNFLQCNEENKTIFKFLEDKWNPWFGNDKAGMDEYEREKWGKRFEGILILLAVKELNDQSNIPRRLHSKTLKKWVETRREKALKHLVNSNLPCHPKIKLRFSDSHLGIKERYSMNNRVKRVSRKMLN